LDCICGITYSLHQHFFSSWDGLQKSHQNLSTKFGKYFWCRWLNIFSSKHPKCGSAAEICDGVSHCHIMQFVHTTLCHHCVINNLFYKNWRLAFQMNIMYKVLWLAVCPSVCQSRHYRPRVHLSIYHRLLGQLTCDNVYTLCPQTSYHRLQTIWGPQCVIYRLISWTALAPDVYTANPCQVFHSGSKTEL